MTERKVTTITDLPTELCLEFANLSRNRQSTVTFRVSRKFWGVAVHHLYSKVRIPHPQRVKNGVVGEPSPLLTFLSTVQRVRELGIIVRDLSGEARGQGVPVQSPAVGCAFWVTAPSIFAQVRECELVGTILSFLPGLVTLKVDLRGAYSVQNNPDKTSLQLLFGDKANIVQRNTIFVPGLFILKTLDWPEPDIPACIVDLPFLETLTISATCSLPVPGTFTQTPNVSSLTIHRGTTVLLSGAEPEDEVRYDEHFFCVHLTHLTIILHDYVYLWTTPILGP
jgi:hypothetical protein